VATGSSIQKGEGRVAARRILSNRDFLDQFPSVLNEPLVLDVELLLVERRLRQLEADQRGIVEEKMEAAEQSGDNWHDGAFRATDDAAKVISDQARVLFNARSALAVGLPADDEDRVTFGSTVTVDQDGAVFTIQIVGVPTLHPDTDSEACSVESPLARAVIGRRVGEKCSFELGGRQRDLTVLALDQAATRDSLGVPAD
jgi:transcription elongation GreA/GreB family factor